MKKNIWIFNHYASDTFFDRGGRHYWFAKYLIKEGYNVNIFCASTVHGTDINVDTQNEKYIEKEVDGIPYIFIKTPSYVGNGKKRIGNMVTFYRRLFPVSEDIEEKYGKPDVIYASSVHPLTLLAGIKIAKKLRVKCVSEIRDLWPFTLVEFGMLKENSIITKLLYKGEKYLYKKSDKIIFTFKDGKEYIKERHWENQVLLDKVYYINNGIDMEEYKEKIETNYFYDEDLETNLFKVMYTGAIGLPNQVDKLVKAAEEIQNNGLDDIVFLIYGDGLERENLESYCKEKNLKNVLFKGKIDKLMIPYVLSKGNVNMIMAKESDLYKYGLSTNKIFDYLASGKPIISNNKQFTSITGTSNCLIVDEKLVNGILTIYNESEIETKERGKSAECLVKQYDFEYLTKALINVLYK